MDSSSEKSQQLNGLRVMVTRPKPMGIDLCEQIDAAGGESIYFPTISIMPVEDPIIAERQIAKLDRQDWLIFVSAQAVYMSSELIHSYWPRLPGTIKIAAVGAGTAKALQANKLHVDIYPKERWSSIGILALPEFEHVEGKRIAIFRGEGGHDWLAQSLQMRGALISHIVVYRREFPQMDVTEYLNLLKEHRVDVIVCTSGEVMHNFVELVKSAKADLWPVPLVVISARMQSIAKELGFKTILLAKNASHSAIIDVLNQYAENK